MNRLRRSRREITAEVFAVVLGLSFSAVFTVVVLAELTITERVVMVSVAVAVYAVLVLGAWHLIRRRWGGPPPRLGKAGRRALNEAVAGTGGLPPRADESWRPAIRRAALSQTFPTVWMQNFVTLVAILVAVPATVDGGGSVGTVRLLVSISAAAVVAALIAWGAVAFHRPRVRNAISMLEQLDARAAE